MFFTCREDESLPKLTLCTSYETAQELKACFVERDFDILFDDSLSDDIILVSSDLHRELNQFLSSMETSVTPSIM